MLLTWFAAAVLAAAAFAWLAHRYNDRHPAEVAVTPGATGAPIINMSAIRIGGDAGGLIFVVGAVIILAVSLPSVRWFIVASGVLGPLLAMAIRAWRTR